MSGSSPVYSTDYKTLVSVPAINKITIKSTVTKINGAKGGAYAFEGAKNTIETVLFEPNSALESISPCCFLSCKKLSLIDFSPCTKITSIGDEAFKYCTSLESIEVPDTIKTIGNNVFEQSGIRSLHIPASVQSYGIWNCFKCYNLVSFTIDSAATFTSLINHQFTETILDSLKLTKKITTFAGDNFERVKTIKTLEVDPDNTIFKAEDNVIYRDNFKTIVYAAPTKTGTYKIKDGVTKISGCAFHSSAITGVEFPSSLTDIDSFAFYSSSLESVNIPPSVDRIGNVAFSSCVNLSTVILNEGLKTLEASAFNGCDKIQEVVIPSTLKNYGGTVFPLSVKITIKDGADLSFSEGNEFLMNGAKTYLIQCYSSKPTLILPNTITKIVKSSFQSIGTISNLIIPENTPLNTIDPYAFAYSTIAEINLPETVTIIKERAFFQCTKLRSIHFGKSFTTLESEVFTECESLETITSTQSNKLITFGNRVFSGCVNLVSAEFHGRIQSMKEDSFYNSYKLESFVFGNSISSIGIRSFQNSGVVSVTFPSATTVPLTSIPVRCFYNCTKLREFNIPEGIESIMDEALAFTAITTITLSTTVTDLKDYCFKECSALDTFTIPAGSQLSSIGFGVFYNCHSFRFIDNHCSNFEKSNEALFNKRMTELYVLPPLSPIKFFSFPTQLERVGAFALQGCINIQLIFVPTTVTEIMQAAFSDCINLCSINIPKECTTIGPDVFRGCKKIQCGIPIENTDPEFRNLLVTSAGLSKSAIEDCSLMCPSMKRGWNYHSIIPFLSILLVF